MRFIDFNKIKWDKNYIIGTIVVLILAIISGIVLYIFTNINSYFVNYTEIYVYYIFNFKNGSLFFSHFISELFYIYAFFLIAYFTKFKYLTLIILFVRSIFVTIYFAIMCCYCGIGGVVIALVVYLPAFVLSVILCVFIVEAACVFNKKYVFFVPAVLALINSLTVLIIVNVLFRIIIVIV